MIDAFELEQSEIDRDRAYQRAADLITDDPSVTTEAVLAVLEDEFVGSYYCPAGDDGFVRDVDRLVSEAVGS